MHLRIATRKSPLALWQSEHVAARLRALRPDVTVSLVPLSTRGDEVLDRSLAAIGGKGLFLKELELALTRGEADLAVHSLKDVPVEPEPGFTIAAILERGDSADAFVSNHYADIDSLPPGGIVGTSSLRRHAQLIARRPDLLVRDLRGNVNTRLAKLDAGQYHAIILAVAGLVRLGFGERIRARLSAPDWLPAAAQGAICIETRSDAQSVMEVVFALHHHESGQLIAAERAMNRALGGSCQVSIAALAVREGAAMHLYGMVGDIGRAQLLRADAVGAFESPDRLGISLAQELLNHGAAGLLQQLA